MIDQDVWYAKERTVIAKPGGFYYDELVV